MEAATASHLLETLRDCGLYTPEQLSAAEQVVAAGGTDPQIADKLLKLEVLTLYQNRRARIGRVQELFFGRYFILDKLGEGGMGKVYSALQLPDNRLVALKMIRPQLMSNKTAVSRYMREVQACASLEHPNIVALLDADEINGRHYLAMEYVDGIDLARIVREFGKTPEMGLPQYQEACEYVRQAALGLQHAHDRNYVHRDIKPSNILVMGERPLPGTNGKATVKILDMGLVRSTVDDDSDKTELTRDGTVVGTPEYMAPEQAKNSSSVDARADLYSLGCTLFYLLKGTAPFPDGAPIEKLLCHQTEPPPDLRKIRNDLPEELIQIVEKLLKKKPDERFSSARELARRLEPFTPAGEHLGSRANLVTTPSPRGTPSGSHAPVPKRSPMPPSDIVRITEHDTPGVSGGNGRGSGGTLPNDAATTTIKTKIAKRATADKTPAPKSDSFPSMPKEPDSAVARVLSEAGQATASKRSNDVIRTSRVLKKEPKKKRIPGWSIALLSMVATTALIGFGFLLARGTRPTSPTEVDTAKSPPTTEPVTSEPTQPDGELPPVKGVIPAHDLVPDKTNGAIVIYAKPFWKKIESEPMLGNRLVGRLMALAGETKFDPRNSDRILIYFTNFAKDDQYIILGETGVNRADFRQMFRRTVLAKPIPYAEYKAPWPKYGGLVGGRFHALSTSLALLTSLVEQYQAKRQPDQVSWAMKAALDAVDTAPEKPLILLYAGENWKLPDGRSLSNLKISSLKAEVRLVNEEFVYDLKVVGRDRVAVRSFVIDYLGTELPAKYLPLKPIAEAIKGKESAPHATGGEFEVKVSGKIPWTVGRRALELMLPPANAK